MAEKKGKTVPLRKIRFAYWTGFILVPLAVLLVGVSRIRESSSFVTGIAMGLGAAGAVLAGWSILRARCPYCRTPFDFRRDVHYCDSCGEPIVDRS